jgi:hypothetical protein
MTPEERWTRIEQQTAENQRQIEKNTAAIRDLIGVSRTIVDTQQTTEKQLQLLIKTLDAFIRGFQKPNGNQ